MPSPVAIDPSPLRRRLGHDHARVLPDRGRSLLIVVEQPPGARGRPLRAVIEVLRGTDRRRAPGRAGSAHRHAPAPLLPGAGRGCACCTRRSAPSSAPAWRIAVDAFLGYRLGPAADRAGDDRRAADVRRVACAWGAKRRWPCACSTLELDAASWRRATRTDPSATSARARVTPQRLAALAAEVGRQPRAGLVAKHAALHLHAMVVARIGQQVEHAAGGAGLGIAGADRPRARCAHAPSPSRTSRTAPASRTACSRAGDGCRGAGRPARIATISACAVGSCSVMLRFQPSPRTSPSAITSTAPTGISSSSRSARSASASACRIQRSSSASGRSDAGARHHSHSIVAGGLPLMS